MGAKQRIIPSIPYTIVMNKYITVIACLFLFLGTMVAQNSDKRGAVITAEKTEFDFGTIKEVNGVVTHIFTIKNEGNAPLVITRVSASCGCTKPEFSTEPIAPGKESKIKVSYNPAGRPGQFTKSIAVYSNGKDGAFVLQIRGIVE